MSGRLLLRSQAREPEDEEGQPRRASASVVRVGEAGQVSDGEGVALNQLINVAVAEKLSALRAESYFRERAERANILEALDVLKRAGSGKPPVGGDALPDAKV